MKKTFKMEDLDCAHCANKMEEGIQKLEGVTSARVNFLTQKLVIDAPEEAFDAILAQAVKICKKVEPDCNIILK